jgi:nitroreductase
MSIAELVNKTRSYRRFDESKPMRLETLRELVDIARLTASGSNMQPLKYVLCVDRDTNARAFELLRWAGYLKDWPGPEEGERPTGYIIVLTDTQIRANPGTDHGIAAQTIMLAATERGFGGCMLGSVDRTKMRELFSIPERYEITLVLALGVPVEQVVLEPVGPDGKIEYYRDANKVHHVPKRSLQEVILQEHS